MQTQTYIFSDIYIDILSSKIESSERNKDEATLQASKRKRLPDRCPFLAYKARTREGRTTVHHYTFQNMHRTANCDAHNISGTFLHNYLNNNKTIITGNNSNYNNNNKNKNNKKLSPVNNSRESNKPDELLNWYCAHLGEKGWDNIWSILRRSQRHINQYQ